jgi:hypothetical protein
MIEPSVEAVLKSPYSIRAFYLVFSGVCAICVLGLVLFAALTPQGWLQTSAIALLSTLASSVAVIMMIYGVWIFVTPASIRNAVIRILPRFEISIVADALSDATNNYWFLGRGGSYFRSYVLPKLDRLSQRDRRHITLRVVLPNPKVARSAEIYKDMLVSLGEDADEHSLLRNVAATVLAIALRTTTNPYLVAKISLIPTLPVLRFDISDQGALITRDARDLPAIFCSGSNPCHQAFLDAVENELRQGTSVDCQHVYENTIQTNTDFDRCILGMSLGESVTVRELVEIIKLGRHRYA